RDSIAVLARAWLAFRYWGWNHTNLGVLNGSVSALPSSLRAQAVDAHPFTGQTRIGTVSNEHFVLLADLAAVRSSIGVNPIVDVREAAEFEGTTFGTTSFDTTCLDSTSCSATFSGRIASSVNVPASALQNADGTLKPLSDLDAATASLDRARTAYLYDLDGHESAVAAFAFLGVIGQPARWYAASFIEWGAFNASHPNSGLRALPSNSPWRTDEFPALTEGTNNWSTLEQGIRPLVFDPKAASSDGVQQSDVTYKQNPPALPAVGAGEGGC
ncbi:MAG: sulfurtransferase, partial [Archangium sp.]